MIECNTNGNLLRTNKCSKKACSAAIYLYTSYWVLRKPDVGNPCTELDPLALQLRERQAQT